ncbi:hypothetical protein [Demequina maris]|uniref:hypothetical protein n=1 Tax=Demequina maris TaxID=1638982 RepID=UPI00078048C0|nr:hypothetical protein [Demequina maris]
MKRRSTAVVVLAAICLGAAAWGAYLLATQWSTVYWNLGSNSHAYAYALPVLYASTAVLAVTALVRAGRTRSAVEPVVARGHVIVLAVLLALTAWGAVATLAGRAFAV